MRAKFIPLSIFACVIAVSVSSTAARQRETRERGVLVSVSTSKDVPVTDMKPADFVVKENGVAREVLRVSPAPPPSHVVLMIDDSQAMQPNISYLRPAMVDFVASMAALTPPPQIQLMTFGERPMKRVDFTPNPEPVLDAVKRLFPITNSGAYFLEALTDACKDLKKRDAASPIIVAFVAESGPEFSNDLHTQVADALRGVGASLWALALQQGSQPAASTAARERSAVLGDVTGDSGGMDKLVLSGQGIEPGFKIVTSLITSRYLVVYGRPESLVPPDKIDVSSKRKDVRVRASKWTGK